MFTLVVASALLVPVVYLFRFLGCEFKGASVLPQQSVRLEVRFPNPPGEEPIAVTMSFVSQETTTELEGSPFDLGLVRIEDDDRLFYRATVSIAEDGYDVTCNAGRSDGGSREGECSGELNAPDRGISFAARETTSSGELEELLCFDPITPA